VSERELEWGLETRARVHMNKDLSTVEGAKCTTITSLEFFNASAVVGNSEPIQNQRRRQNNQLPIRQCYRWKACNKKDETMALVDGRLSAGGASTKNKLN
jgi:hypothetical protein